MKRIHLFIKKLQRADDARKRRWYIGTAAVSMSLVLLMWGFYVSAFVENENISETNTSADNSTTQSGALDTFSLGWEKMKEDMFNQFQNPENTFGGAIGGLTEKASQTNDIVVESSESNFYFAGAEEIPTSTLPIAKKK